MSPGRPITLLKIESQKHQLNPSIYQISGERLQDIDFLVFTSDPILFTDCDRTFTNKTGTIESPSYPSPYPKNALCVYKINRPTGERINISFQAFDVHSYCLRDYLEVGKIKNRENVL